MSKPLTFLCISCEYKGLELLRSLKREGNRVLLVTCDKLKDEPWPRDIIDDIFFIPEQKHCVWDMEEVKLGLAHVMRQEPIDRVIAIDDFDVEKGAMIREEFRIPGLGLTTCRYFRDKLAMRLKAEESGIPVPGFTALFSDRQIQNFLDQSEPSWIIKPRAEAAAAGLTKVASKEEVWQKLNELGDTRHQYLIEEFKPGDVYHVDSLAFEGKIKFSRVSKYMNTPFEVAHEGGIFRSHIVTYGSAEEKELQSLNRQLLRAFGLQTGVSHSEFIRNKADGKYYFLETSFRVCGAHLAEMVEASSGINLWSEWGRLETAKAAGSSYSLPKVKKEYAGIVVSLSRFDWPDTSGFTDPEICWRLEKMNHIGFIVKSNKQEKIISLLDDYAQRIGTEFHSSLPPKKLYRE